jgi:hypothetical protein
MPLATTAVADWSAGNIRGCRWLPLRDRAAAASPVLLIVGLVLACSINLPAFLPACSDSGSQHGDGPL